MTEETEFWFYTTTCVHARMYECIRIFSHSPETEFDFSPHNGISRLSVNIAQKFRW